LIVIGLLRGEGSCAFPLHIGAGREYPAANAISLYPSCRRLAFLRQFHPSHAGVIGLAREAKRVGAQGEAVSLRKKETRWHRASANNDMPAWLVTWIQGERT